MLTVPQKDLDIRNTVSHTLLQRIILHIQNLFLHCKHQGPLHLKCNLSEVSI